MAETPTPRLRFNSDGSAQRLVVLPDVPPDLGDDFNWRARDFDAIRIAMVEELSARFPEHSRWTAADPEVVLVEVLASALDQLHDMADRVSAEAYLETARRPESVRRLLSFIGYDAGRLAGLVDPPLPGPDAPSQAQQLERLWTDAPALMEQARRDGPRQTHAQRRMVTLADYTARLEEHPLVKRAAAGSEWTGSWTTLRVAVVLPWADARLDVPWSAQAVEDRTERADLVRRFHGERGLPVPDLSDDQTTPRAILAPYLQAYRMVGQDVQLQDPVPVGVELDLGLELAPNYFQSEVRRAVADALGSGAGGFFEPGRLRFGEDLHLSDIYQLLLGLEGVARVSVHRFKRFGAQYAPLADDGRIVLSGLEMAVCDNQPSRPARGSLHLTLSGGRRG